MDAVTLVAVGVVLLFLASLLSRTDGHFVPQVADLYLVCQYARAMAEGHPFQYNAGEPYSTGATSLSLTAVLALLHRIGLRGEWLVASAIALGALCYLASVRLAYRIGARFGPREAWLSGLLVALGGPVVWGFLYGSDTAPFLWLSLLLFDRLLARSTAGVAVAGSLLALTRPEGLVIGVILGGDGTRQRREDTRWYLRWLPALVGVGVLLLYRSLTGYWVSTSVSDKSLLENYGLPDTVALVVDYLGDVLRGLLLGFYPAEMPVGFSMGWSGFYFAPLALVLMCLGVALAPEPHRHPLRLWTAAVATVFLLVAPNVFMGVHFNRYLMWGFPTLHVLSALGLGRLARLVSTDAAVEGRLFQAGAAVLLAFGVLATARFAVHYGEMGGELYRRDVAVARWIEAHLPAGTSVANLATSVEYLTGHHNVNLHGVTSPAFFGNRTAEREAGTLEALERLAPAERPRFLLTTASTHESLPSMRELVEPSPLFETSSLSDEILLFRMKYDVLGRDAGPWTAAAREAIAGREVVDQLDVCDSRDEREHGYRFESRRGGARLYGAARVAAYGDEKVIDGGRVILGGESFEVRTRAGRDLVVVVRTSAEGRANVMRASGSGQYAITLPEAVIEISAGGRPAATRRFRPAEGWDDQAFVVPASLISDGRTRLDLSGRYTAFHYWFYQ